MEKLTDIEIAEGLRNNDIRVFNQVFDEFYPQVHYFASRLINNDTEAQDIVIGVFNRFWKVKENFSTGNDIRAFLYVATRNACLDFLRYQQRQKEGKNEYSSHLQSMEDKWHTERMIIESDLMQTIYTQVQKLPDKCREIFILTYFKGLKANEIAGLLGITVSTVTTQRQRAIQYLRGVLSEEHFLLLCLVLKGLHQMTPASITIAC
jgi:RNA polymerase sigma-70 factor (family 1)